MSDSRYKTAKQVSIVSAAINTALAIIKVIVGLFGHSAALVADGLHSFADLFSDFLVILAAKMGGQVPDKEHPYGHQRIETIAAIIIALILLVVGASIVYDAIMHIVKRTPTPTPQTIVIIIAFISIAANEWLFRYTLKAGKKIHSNLLITNAWHNRSDVYVSIIVLISVLGAMLGWVYLDEIGAGIISILILKMGFKMIWEGVSELIDTAVDEKELGQIKSVINRTPGVLSLHQLRTRLSGGAILVDVHLIVDSKISVSEGHYIGEQVHKHLLEQCDHVSDVTVHVDPEDDEKRMPSLDLPDRPSILKQCQQDWHALSHYQDIHTIQLHYLDGQLDIDVLFPSTLCQTVNIDTLLNEYKAASTLRNVKHISFHFVA